MKTPDITDDRLDRLKSDDGWYYLPGSLHPRSRQEARDILEINDWVGNEVPTDVVTTKAFLLIIREIDDLKAKVK